MITPEITRILHVNYMSIAKKKKRRGHGRADGLGRDVRELSEVRIT